MKNVIAFQNVINVKMMNVKKKSANAKTKMNMTTSMMINVTKNNALTSELQMVQHAVLERYTQYKVINDQNLLEGNSITYQEVQNIANEIGVTLKDTDNYYELNPEDLKEIGIMKSEDTYIVNYETGEVINKTKLKTISGDALYTYAVE